MPTQHMLRFAMAATLYLGAAGAWAAESSVPWDQLTPQEQQALKPFEQRWSQLPPERQHHLRENALRWQQMTPEERVRPRTASAGYLRSLISILRAAAAIRSTPSRSASRMR